MNQNKTMLKIIGKESVYMLVLTLIACISALLQTVLKVYSGDYSSFIFSGSIYRYNSLFYVLGMALYFGCVFVLFKYVYGKDIRRIKELNVPRIVLCLIVLILWGLILFAAVFMGLFITILGLSVNLIPEACLFFTIFGWPVVTIIIIVVMMFIRSNTESLVNVEETATNLYNPEIEKPVVMSSICTGEKTAGFRNNKTGHYREVMAIKSELDLQKFKEECGVDSVDTEY